MKHLMFLFADHFEPAHAEATRAWATDYPEIARRFTDADGRHLQHTWFYDGLDENVLETLSGLCRARLGEIEIHLHHSHDTADGLREKLEHRKRLYARHGALITTAPEPQAVFGFVHGKWSLDNSRGDEFCGVNNELAVLRDAGCYADFTFPAWGRMQPAKRNSIYYATDDPAHPKSYDTGVDVAVGRPPGGDLLIVQGPGRLSGIPPGVARLPGAAWLADRLWLTCAMDAHLPPWPARVDRWVKANVHVAGRPQWVFVKAHTHGARARNYRAYFDRTAEQLHAHLNSRYNNGSEWKLHYVTAREAFNIIKAAEAGKTGDPGEYRDYRLAPYRNRA